jgi:MFS family permease
VVAFAAAAVLIITLLRPDPLLLAASGADTGGADTGGAMPRRPGADGLRGALAAVGAVPAARLALVTVGTAHAVMVAVMVMTPVHLHDGGATLEVVGVVLSVHIAGMYALSPVFGLLSDRWGRRPVIGTGIVLLAAAMLLAGTAGERAHVRLGIALTVLGLGWSACVVAGSTLLSETVAPEARMPVQGLSDLVMGLTAARSSGPAGIPASTRCRPSCSCRSRCSS